MCPLADSYITTSAHEACLASDGAATRKSVKYTDIAVESLGPVNTSGRDFLSKLGLKLSTQSAEDRETSFLFQRLSVLIQRFNAILLHDTFMKEEEE